MKKPLEGLQLPEASALKKKQSIFMWCLKTTTDIIESTEKTMKPSERLKVGNTCSIAYIL